MAPAGTDASQLSCPSCGAAFSLQLDPQERYLCGRCDARVAGPVPSSFDTLRKAHPTWLYGRTADAAAHPPDDEPRPRRIGRYALVEEIGRGGMGVVYRARDPELSRDVALKVLIAGSHSAREQVERFLREARAAARLAHPGLVRVHDIGRTLDGVYFTMDLVEGPSLREVLDQREALPLREALRIGAAVARALHAAHVEGLVHRDVKPGNVLLRVDGTPLLADFGLATELEDDSARLTRSGQVLGTPAYMAPEQTRGSREAIPASDQYALAAILYEALSGTPPYPGDSAVEVLYQLIATPPDPLRARSPGLPREVCIAIDKAMSREPERRYATCLAFAEDLERILAGEPITARPPSLGYRLRRAVRRHRRLLGAGVVALVAAGTAVEVSSLVLARSERARIAQREDAAAQALAEVQGRVRALAGKGETSEALALLETFAAQEAHRGTSAAARAHLLRGDLAAASAEAATAVDAYAASYAGASRTEDQDAALRALARQFRDGWRWDALAVVADTLVARTPGLATDPEVARWRAEAALALRDGPAALDALQAVGGDGLARLLATGAPAPHLGGRLAHGDVDGDGTLEAAVVPGGDARVRLVELSPGLPTTAVVALPADLSPPQELHLLPGEPPLLLVRDRSAAGLGTATVLALEGQQVAPLASWPSSRLMDAARADLDADGQAELYLGVGPYDRQLVRVDPDRGWSLTHPHPQTDATGSDIVALAVADLQGDGTPELVVSAGAWGAYDVRVFAADGDGLTRLARRKLGFVSDLAVVRSPDGDRVLAAKSDEYPNAEMFPSEHPYGERAGIRVLTLDGRALSVERSLELPALPGPLQVGQVLAADVDGDRRLDVVAQVGAPGGSPSVVVWPAGLDGPSEPVVLGGMSLRAAAQLDDDDASELVVGLVDSEPSTWVLGTGAEVVPPLARTLAAPAEVPRLQGLSQGARAAWARAEDLVGMGLGHLAGRRLEDLADTAVDPELAAHARLRAAALAESVRDDARAGELYAAAASFSPLVGPARAGALRNHLLRHDHEHALATATAILADPASDGAIRDEAAAVVERLRPELAAVTHLALDFSTDLPAEVEVPDPVGVRTTPRDGGARLVVVTDGGPLLRVPLRTSGGRLGMTVDLSIERVEWAGGILVELRGPGETRLGVGARGWGGGGYLDHEVLCTVPGDTSGVRGPVDGPAAPRALRLRVDASTATSDVRCELTTAEGQVLHRAVLPLPGPLPAGAWELVVTPSSHGGVDAPMAAEAVLSRIELVGGHLELDAVGTSPRRGRQLAQEAWADALGSWPEGEEAAARALALIEVGRGDEAEAALARLAASPERDAQRQLTALLRSRPAAVSGPLRAVLGPAFWRWFHGAWAGAIHAHPSDPSVQRALTTSLAGVEKAGSDPRAELDDLRAAALLLQARGRAWSALGEPSAARRDWRAADRLAEQILPRLSGADERAVRESRTRAWVDLAALEADRDGEAALAAARRALEGATAREVTADILRARPELAPYLREPAWRALLDR